ncbi:MAG: B12-binding domain-containing radical SAM protein [Clostridiales bacterium]|nr:B12-binding domain-containing radical SAM protein [Clostridiales bacterium]
MIWLVDYTYYEQPIDERLAEQKKQYFHIKKYKRWKMIGPTADVKTKTYGMGLLRIATILACNHIPVKYIHWEMLEEALERGQPMPETIAFSTVCPTVPKAAGLCEKVKAVSPETRCYLGGIHVTLDEEETKERFPVFDEFITGFEYESAKQLAGTDLPHVPAVYADFSLLPYPIKDYAINTFSAMGCPFHCSYCADGLAPHFKAAEDGMISQFMKMLPEKTLIHFFDSVLGGSVQGAFDLCDRLIQLNHPFILSCDMRADLLTPELVRKMEQAGFREIRLGLESVDMDLLLQNKRTLSYEVFLKQVKMIKEETNLYIAAYTVLGLPGTTYESHMTTLEQFRFLLEKHYIDEIKNTLYVPYPMEGVDYSKRGLILDSMDWNRYDRQSFPVYHTKELSAQQIWDLYVETLCVINDAWCKSLGYERISEIPAIEGYYNEYIETNYLK